MPKCLQLKHKNKVKYNIGICLYLVCMKVFFFFFFLWLVQTLRVAAADHGLHIYLAQVYMPNALPDTNPPQFSPGLGTAPRLHWHVQPLWLELFWTSWGLSVLTRDASTYGHN